MSSSEELVKSIISRGLNELNGTIMTTLQNENSINLKPIRKSFVDGLLSEISELVDVPSADENVSKYASKKKIVKERPPRDLLLDAFNLHVQSLKVATNIQSLVKNTTAFSSSSSSSSSAMMQRKDHEIIDLSSDAEENKASAEQSNEPINSIDEHMNFEVSVSRSINVDDVITNTAEMSALASSSSSSSKMTRKQMLSNAALEKRRVQRRLRSQSEGDSDAEQVTDTMVSDAILSSSLDRLQSLFSRQYKPAPTQVLAQQRNAKSNGKLPKFPFTSLKRQVGWLKVSQQDLHSQSLPLSEELVLFAKYVSLSEEESACRHDLISAVTELINCKWPDATIVPFGSFPAGLSTFTSDIDITVHNTDTQLGGTQSILSVPMSGKVGLSHNDDLFVTDFTNDEEYVDDIERGQIVTSSKIANESGFVNDFDGSIDETNLAKPSHSSIVKEREQTSTSSNKRRKFELDISHDVMFNVKEMVQMQIPVTNASDTPKTRTAAALDRDIIVHVESGSDDDSSEYNNANTDEHIDRLCSSTNGKAHYKTMIDLTDLEDGGRLDHFQTTGKAAITHDEKLKEQELKRMAVDELRSLFPYMVNMDWVKQIELRSHARVPIISFVHKNCIGCDVSLGMQSKHTTDLVTQMRDRSGRDFVPLSVFLKMFLTLQELDQPFTGGIGSFKLYAMVAFIIDKYNRKQVQSHTSSSSSSSRGRHDREQSHQSLGRILLEFFSYFGQRKNLNLSTVIQIYDTEVTFDANRKVDMCQGTFQQAYLALSIAIGKQERGESHISVVRNSYTISNSLLGLIINTEELQRRREESLRSCRLYPARNELDRCMVATKLLSELNKLTVPKPPVALEDVRSRRPFLMTLLRSFPSVPLALKSVKSSQIRLHSSNSDSGGGSNNNYNKSSGRQSSDNYKKNDRFTSSEYENNNSYMHENSRTGMKRKVATFSRGGVVGSSFQNNNGGGNSAQKSKKKRSSSFKSPSVSSNGSRTPSISSAVAKEQKLRKKLMEKMKERSRK